jgi:hypothetical protein
MNSCREITPAPATNPSNNSEITTSRVLTRTNVVSNDSSWSGKLPGNSDVDICFSPLH